MSPIEWIFEHAWFGTRAVGLILDLIKGESPLWFEEVGISLDEQWNFYKLRDDSIFW